MFEQVVEELEGFSRRAESRVLPLVASRDAVLDNEVKRAFQTSLYVGGT